MASLINVFISIIAIIAISGEAAIFPLNLPDARVSNYEKTSDTQSILTPIVTDKDKFNMTWPLPLQTKLNIQISPMPTYKTGINSTISQHESQKELRTEPVKIDADSVSGRTILSPISSIFPFNENVEEIPIIPKLTMKYWHRRRDTITVNGVQEYKLGTRYRRSAAQTLSNTNSTAVEEKQEMTKPSYRFKLKCYVSIVGMALKFFHPSRECMYYYLDPISYYS